jgi:hypothetical protein
MLHGDSRVGPSSCERARAFGRVVTAHSRHYLPPRRRAARPVSVGAGQAVVDGRPAPARHRDTERRDGVTLLRRHLIIGGDARLERRHRRSVPVGLPSPGLVTESVLRHSLARRSCNEPLARRGAGRGSSLDPAGSRHSTPRADDTSGAGSRVEPSSIFTWCHAEAALEVAVEVTLVSEAGGGGDVGDRLAGFEQSAGLADAVGDLQGMRW